MYVVIDQSSSLSISIFSPSVFYSILHITEYLTNSHVCKHVWCVYVCVCSYRCAQLARWGARCEVVTRMETLSHGSVGWKPLVWVCHVLCYFPIETRETSHRSPICRGVHMYVSTHVHTWVHLHACVWVGLSKLYG